MTCTLTRLGVDNEDFNTGGSFDLLGLTINKKEYAVKKYAIAIVCGNNLRRQIEEL